VHKDAGALSRSSRQGLERRADAPLPRPHRAAQARLNAFITVDREKSLAQASAADARIAQGERGAAHRHPDRAQGPLLREGLAHHLRLEDPRPTSSRPTTRT
jgi:hypothetical protein